MVANRLDGLTWHKEPKIGRLWFEPFGWPSDVGATITGFLVASRADEGIERFLLRGAVLMLPEDGQLEQMVGRRALWTWDRGGREDECIGAALVVETRRRSGYPSRLLLEGTGSGGRSVITSRIMIELAPPGAPVPDWERWRSPAAAQIAPPEVTPSDFDRLRALSAEVDELVSRGAYDRAAFERLMAATDVAAGELGGEFTEFLYSHAEQEWYEP